jgi:D-methionine transport system permease protein
MSTELWIALGHSTLQTLIMVFVSALVATLIGLPMGVGIYISRPTSLMPCRWLNRSLALVINVLRSIPFIILLVAVIPFTRFIIGTSIGTAAAIVPLSIGAAPFVARIIDNALQEVPYGLIEAGLAMGMNRWQLISKILLAESLPNIINGMTLTIVTLIGYSAMAGAVGGGGLGDLAIQYGYNMFNTQLMIVTVIVLIVLVQCIQWLGERMAKRLYHVYSK